MKRKVFEFHPLLKLIYILFFISLIVLTPVNAYSKFMLYTVNIIILLFLGKINGKILVKRLTLILSFVLILIFALPFHHFENDQTIKVVFFNLSKRGVLLSLNVFIKAILSIMLLYFFSSTSDYEELIISFKKLGVPPFVITILGLMLRYFSLLRREGQNMIMGRNARYVGKGFVGELKTFGHIIGVLFLKTLSAGESVYNAMESRLGNGLSTERKGRKIKYYEFITLSIGFFLLILIRFWG